MMEMSLGGLWTWVGGSRSALGELGLMEKESGCKVERRFMAV